MAGDMAAELKQQAMSVAKEKADSTKSALKDTMNNVKTKMVNDAKETIAKQLLQPDTTKGKLIDDLKTNSGGTIKASLNNLNPFKKKKQSKDSTKN
jgi:hypothetical protein